MTENLTGMPLHQPLQRRISRLIEQGHDPADVINAALDVAIASKTTFAGPRQAARELYVASMDLARLAEEAEVSAAAPRH